MPELYKLLSERKTVFFDGAMGTILSQRGLPPGARVDIMNIIAPDVVRETNRAYVNAGSDIICSNTFGANRHALKDTGYTVEQIISAGVLAAREAAGDCALVAYDMSAIGEFMEPYGSLTYGDAYDCFAEQARYAQESGADLVAIETMSDLTETRAAITAVRENSDLPVFVTMTFGENGRTYTGARASELSSLANELEVAAVGLNCSLLPEKMLDAARELREHTSLPLIIKPNAGLPDSGGGYDVTPEEFARQMLAFREVGVKIVGACCGSNPEFIIQLRKAFS